MFNIRTEYKDLQHKSPYSVSVQENADQENLRIRTLLAQGVWLNL